MAETHSLFNTFYEIEKSIISMDNGAIVLGRNDRKLFDFLENTNTFLNGLEKVHHPLHAMVTAGGANPAIVAQDKAIELILHQTLQGAVFLANSIWSKGKLEAWSEIIKLAQNVLVESRSPVVPIVKNRCPICWLDNHITIKEKEAETRFRILGYPALKGVTVKLFQNQRINKSKWEYRICDREVF